MTCRGCKREITREEARAVKTLAIFAWIGDQQGRPKPDFGNICPACLQADARTESDAAIATAIKDENWKWESRTEEP